MTNRTSSLSQNHLGNWRTEPNSIVIVE